MIIRTAIKGGLATGTILYTKELGVWGNSKQTEEVYNDIKHFLQPHLTETKKRLPLEIPPLPKTGEIRFLAKHYYNQGVKNTFHFISMVPCYTGQLIGKAKNGISKALEAASPQISK